MGGMRTTKKLLIGDVDRALAEKAMRDRGRELAGAIREGLPEGTRFVLVLGDDDGESFFSDSERGVAAGMLRRVLLRLWGP